MTPHHSFKLDNTHTLDGLGITVAQYTHQKTGLKHYHLACENTENAFMIGFRTQPATSMGEAHILEHVVLCGSQKYPVRDPFFSMIKRSVSTFMNAMTAADWTVYPFATQDKEDFFNLLSVYTDAVFFPNIDKNDFAQEGVRVQLDGERLAYHGIVFNEMKGAMGAQNEQLYRAISSRLFTQTTYHHNSGGDPLHIVDLTHADLLDFHARHYHPSNGVMMSFGDIDPSQIQQKVDADALVHFDDTHRPAIGKIYHSIAEPDSTPKQELAYYGVDEITQSQTHHVMAWRLPTITCAKTRLAMRLLEGVLVEHAGSPLRAFLDSHPQALAASPFLGLDDSHYHMVFYAGVRGSEVAHGQAVFDGVMDLLKTIAQKPIARDEIDTVLHQIELDKRHIGGDGMPYGLNLLLEGFSTAIHGGDVVGVWQLDDALAWLKTQLTDEMWLPNLIKTHLIDNPNRLNLTLAPSSTHAAELESALQDKLNQISKNLSDDDKARIIADKAGLDARQAAVDDVSVLPKIALSSLSPTIAPWAVGETIDGITPVHRYEKGTNGLYYYQLIVKLDDTAMRHPLMPIYLALLGELGTSDMDARTFAQYQAAQSSGVTARVSLRADVGNVDSASAYLAIATRALASKPCAIALVKTVWQDTVFSETARLQELLQARVMSLKSRISGAGHAYALQLASRGAGLAAKLEHAYSGLPALNVLADFIKNGDYDALAQDLADLHAYIQSLPVLHLLIGENKTLDDLLPMIQKLSFSAPRQPNAPSVRTAFGQLTQEFERLDGDVAYLISGNVYHHGVSFKAVESTHPDAAALMVCALMLQNGYLHKHIREQGGAYGGGASFDGNIGAFRFYSYRDPNLQQTLTHFKDSVTWLLNADDLAQNLEEAILGIVSSMDKPSSPAGDAVRSCFARLHGRDEKNQQALRERLMAVNIEDVKRVAREYLNTAPTRALIAPVDAKDEVLQHGYTVYTLL